MSLATNSLRFLALFGAAAFLSFADPLFAQDSAARAEEPDDRQAGPIVVIADPDAEKRVVTVGSRLPRSAPFAGTGKATNVGTPGLGPQSGMSPHEKFRRIKRKDCVSNDRNLSKIVICALASGDKALAEGDYGTAVSLYRHVADNTEYSPYERHAASEKIFAAAQSADDPALKSEALEGLLATELLSAGETRLARLELAKLAAAGGRTARAIALLEGIVLSHLDDTNSLVRLAILQRSAGRSDAAATMARAIGVREAKGYRVPRAWREFVDDGAAREAGN